MKTKKPSTRNGAYKRLFAQMKPYRAKLVIASIVILLNLLKYEDFHLKSKGKFVLDPYLVTHSDFGPSFDL